MAQLDSSDVDPLSGYAPMRAALAARPRAGGAVGRHSEDAWRRRAAESSCPPDAAYPSIAELVAPRMSCPSDDDILVERPSRVGEEPAGGRASSWSDPPRRHRSLHALRQQRSPTMSLLSLAERTHTVQRFFAEYKKGEMIGQGTSGAVFAVTAKKTGVEYACKFTKLDKDASSSSSEVRKELHMLALLSGHPKFVSIHDYFMSDSHSMIIMDRLEGGNLANFVMHKRDRLAEDDCKQIVRSLLEGLAFLHNAGAAHRDLKLDNIMLARKDDLSSVTIVDMGLSKFMGSSNHTVCGSPLYLAPEALLQTVTSTDGRMKARYDEGIDMWACGIMLYILLSGKQPYRTKSREGLGQLIREIASCSIEFEGPAWKTVSPAALHLLRDLLLNYDPCKRVRAQEALSHPWFHSQS